MLRVAVPDTTEFDAFYKSLIAVVPLENVTSRLGHGAAEADDIIPAFCARLPRPPRRGSGRRLSVPVRQGVRRT